MVPGVAPALERPEFADNRKLTLAEAIRGHLDWLQRMWARPVSVDIATGYFNPAGFALLADKLEKCERVRLLLGAEPGVPPVQPLRMPGDPPGERLERKLLGEALASHEHGLWRDRDLLEFTRETDAAIRSLLAFLRSGRIEVRRYERAFLHGKAFLFAGNEGLLSGSSNFTAAGLTSNLELNLGRYDTTPVSQVREWYDKLWEEATPYDLAAVYEARVQPYAPYLIYLRVLWERYQGELMDEAGPGARIRLTTFQSDGIVRAKRIMEKYNGVLIADGVGLGKTFVGGELIRQAVEDQRQRALLIAPAALRDGTWQRFADLHSLYLEKVSYEQLADDKQLGGTHPYLKQNRNDYALVIVDEAQAFRNPDTERARALRALLHGDPPKKLVFMSATPVNNSLWDLYYLLTYFVGHDAAFSGIGVRSLKERFADAMAEDPDDLKPDMLFDILDATAVRRTRHFVRRYYPRDKVLTSDGREILVEFPDPHPLACTYSLDAVLPGFFDEFEQALAPEEGEPLLTLARYAPSRYRPDLETDLSEAALAGLLRSGLLKRFESSSHAFAETCERMAKAHQVFLEGLEQGVVMTARAVEEWEQTDSDEFFEGLVAEGKAEPAAGYNVEELKKAVAADRELLARFAERARSVRNDKDPKLKKLEEEILAALQQAGKEGYNEADFRNRRKILIFTSFADTVDWIMQYLEERIAQDKALAAYRGRIASVTGDDAHSGVSRTEAIYGFAPDSTEAPPELDQDRFDILVTTDVLAEGMNLQQCRNVINYDLPWNPMRLVQRHGRIDRIGSPHKDVYVRCFFPDQRLEELLDLETRIRRKLAQAAASVGLEQEVIPGAATSEIVFAETREEIRKLRKEDPALFVNAGEDPNAHSGEEYRQELRKGMEQYGRQIADLPWGAGSGFRSTLGKGHFFCARIGERLFLRFVPEDRGQLERDTLKCLRMIACDENTPCALTTDAVNVAFEAWQAARANIFEDWQRATDPANLQPRVRPALRAAAAHLRKYPPAGMTQEQIDRLVESIEAPWGQRIERQIREAMQSGAKAGASAAIAETVKSLGLQPYRAPEPLPPIEPSDIRLICWMALQ
jgi:hypothetical protein